MKIISYFWTCLFFLSAFLSSLSAWGQEPIEGLDATRYAIEDPSGVIEYIRLGKKTDAPQKTILFLQGSQPKPLVFDINGTYHLNLPFDYKTLEVDWQWIVISMPHTPLIVAQSHLTPQYNYLPDPTHPDSLSAAYLQANFIDTYVNRTRAVIADLQQRKWVREDDIHLIGHSQGAKIAAVVTVDEPAVKSVALLGFNPDGRFEEMIRRERAKLKAGDITGLEYEKKITDLYAIWREIQESPESHQVTWSDPNKTWTSFSIDYHPYLLNIEIPIYVGYGTEDIVAENCDLLPLEFIERGKKNLTLKPYGGLDHNFFEIENGKPNYEKGYWDKVIKNLSRWLYQGEKLRNRK